MTRTHELLGDILDAAPERIEFLRFFPESPEYAAVFSAENAAWAADDVEFVQQLVWESAALDGNIEARSQDGFFRGRGYADWVTTYGITDRTRVYMLERARETAHPLVRVRHLEFALRTMPPTGRDWVELTREVATGYRALVDHIVVRLAVSAEGSDLWHYFNVIMASASGLNLRNKVGHGLARRRDCARWIVGVVAHLLFALAHTAASEVEHGTPQMDAR